MLWRVFMRCQMKRTDNACVGYRFAAKFKGCQRRRRRTHFSLSNRDSSGQKVFHFDSDFDSDSESVRLSLTCTWALFETEARHQSSLLTGPTTTTTTDQVVRRSFVNNLNNQAINSAANDADADRRRSSSSSSSHWRGINWGKREGKGKGGHSLKISLIWRLSRRQQRTNERFDCLSQFVN